MWLTNWPHAARIMQLASRQKSALPLIRLTRGRTILRCNDCSQAFVCVSVQNSVLLFTLPRRTCAILEVVFAIRACHLDSWPDWAFVFAASRELDRARVFSWLSPLMRAAMAHYQKKRGFIVLD